MDVKVPFPPLERAGTVIAFGVGTVAVSDELIGTEIAANGVAFKATLIGTVVPPNQFVAVALNEVTRNGFRVNGTETVEPAYDADMVTVFGLVTLEWLTVKVAEVAPGMIVIGEFTVADGSDD